MNYPITIYQLPKRGGAADVDHTAVRHITKHDRHMAAAEELVLGIFHEDTTAVGAHFGAEVESGGVPVVDGGEGVGGAVSVVPFVVEGQATVIFMAGDWL